MIYYCIFRDWGKCMLVRKENQIEIWSDVVKGNAKQCYIFTIFVFMATTFLTIQLDLDYTVGYTYIFIFCLIGLPTLLFSLLTFSNILIESKQPKLQLIVNEDFIEVYNKNNTFKIKLEQITNTDVRPHNLKYIYKITYKENNNLKDYEFPVSIINKGLVTVAINEYKNKVNV